MKYNKCSKISKKIIILFNSKSKFRINIFKINNKANTI